MDYKINTQIDVLALTGSEGHDDQKISDMYRDLAHKYPKGYSLIPMGSFLGNLPGEAKINFRIISVK